MTTMLALLSPAKTLILEEEQVALPEVEAPQFMKQAFAINKKLQELSLEEIRSLMSVSEKIGETTSGYIKSFKKSPGKSAKPALLMYAGDVYQPIESREYNKTEWKRAQKSIRIISGLYGVLKPLDLIQPYRLEMKLKFPVDSQPSLQAYWKPLLTEALNEELQQLPAKDRVVVNLASKEYSKAVALPELSGEVLECDFKDKKNGEYKTLGLFAKKARGMMANYIVRQNCRSRADLLDFVEDGYSFSKKLSNDSKLVFTRG